MRMKLAGFAALSFFISCSGDSPPPPITPDIPAPELQVEWVGAVEAGLRLRTNASGRVSFELSRNDSTIFSGSVSAVETTLVQSGLVPNQTYRYRAGRMAGGKVVKTSETLTFVTLDATSHGFAWQKYELGNTGGYLKDVIAISEDDVWAVGYLPVQPMSSVNPDNAAHWNGEEWSLHQLRLFECDEDGRPYGNSIPFVVETVFGPRSNDLWFAWGGGFCCIGMALIFTKPVFQVSI